jgi:peptide/nickel transport system substrate-binding protein
MSTLHPSPDRTPLRTLLAQVSAGSLSRRQFVQRAALLVGSAATAEGLLTRSARAQTASKRDLVIAQGSDISTLDPHFSTAVHDTSVSFNVFDNLVSRHRDDKLHPSLATGWKLVKPTTWEFMLRPDVKFHNGDPCTSADVKFSIERTYSPQAKTQGGDGLHHH